MKNTKVGYPASQLSTYECDVAYPFANHESDGGHHIFIVNDHTQTPPQTNSMPTCY